MSQVPCKTLHKMFLILTATLGIIYCPWPIDEDTGLEMFSSPQAHTGTSGRAWLQTLGTETQALPLRHTCFTVRQWVLGSHHFDEQLFSKHNKISRSES